MYSKKSKKIAAVLTALCLSIGLVACGSEEVSPSTETGESSVVESSVEESSVVESKDASEEKSEEVSNEESVVESTEETKEPTVQEEKKYNIANFDIPDTESMRFVRDMKIGWNLGNSFDANNCTWLSNGLDYETAWCGAKATPELFDVLKEAGFNTIRIPVAWHDHLTDGYTIDEAWLDRVNEVVDYCIDRDMYVILNIHHDNDVKFLYPTNQYLDQSEEYVTAIWSQLSVRFCDYDEHLIFEAMNEPRMVGHNNEWWIDPNNADCKEAIACINILNQDFVNVVRASGGNNETRYLMCPGYCAAPDGVLNSGFVLPTDPIENDNHIILEVHAYYPYSFALESPGTDVWSSANARNVTDAIAFMNDLYKKYVANGIPVVIDEFGSMEKNGNLEARVDHAGCFIANARARGITCVWWDNNVVSGNGERFGIIDRATAQWVFPEIVEAMMKYAQ